LSVPDNIDPKSQLSGTPSQVEGPDLHSIASRFRQQPSPAKMLQLLKDAINGYSPVSVLSQLTVRYLFVRRGEFHGESSEVHRHHAYIEFLAGFLATQPYPAGELKALTVPQCVEIWRRLQDYFDAIRTNLFADALGKADPIQELQFDARNHSLMVRGEAYPHQLEQMAIGLYEEHDTWFRENLGFTIREALNAMQCAMALSAWRRGQLLPNSESGADEDTTET
jgi:hypothetical protein